MCKVGVTVRSGLSCSDVGNTVAILWPMPQVKRHVDRRSVSTPKLEGARSLIKEIVLVIRMTAACKV